MYAATRASTPGTIATERLRSGRLSVGERNALRAARDRSDANIGDRERVDEHIDEHAAGPARRRTSVMFDRRGSGMVREIVEDDASVAGRIAWLAAPVTIRPALTFGSYLLDVPWPWGLVDFAAGAVTPAPGTVRASIRLPHCTARLVRAAGVLPADGTRRVVMYMHGGAFLTCGANTHDRLVTKLSNYADSPVLVMNYRTLPKHSIGEAIDDCYDGYRWLRSQGYGPEQIVLAGDSAGGYLSLALAERLLNEGEHVAAIVCMSPLMQIAKLPKQAHPNIRSDAMFPGKAFDAFVDLITEAGRRHIVDGR